MRVLIVSSSLPHVRGGSRAIVRWTADAIREAGHEVEEYLIPFPRSPRAVASATVALRLLPFADSADRLVAIRWPAHVVRHESKATWFIHHYRELFDRLDGPDGAARRTPELLAYRERFREIDTRTLAEGELFTNSLVVRDRVRHYNGLEAEPLFPPLGGDVSRFRTEEYGDFVFYPSRVTPIKRQLLAVEAMRHVRSGVRLVIAGEPHATAYAQSLRDTVREHGLEDRVELRLEWLPEAEKVDMLARCLAVAYLPLDEDSYGYPALEASHSAKPIVTVDDGGGTLEFVRDGVEGLVTEPDPVALAAAFDRLYEDRTRAAALGAGSQARRAELEISWEHVVSRLVGEQP
jgi:glycosyltransferase involved in cell wall biosynthesis